VETKCHFGIDSKVFLLCAFSTIAEPRIETLKTNLDASCFFMSHKTPKTNKKKQNKTKQNKKRKKKTKQLAILS